MPNVIAMRFSPHVASRCLRLASAGWRRATTGDAPFRLASFCCERQPGVDHERLTRDPSRLVTREIDRAPRDVPAGALGAEERRGPSLLARFGAEVLHHRCPHGTG